MTNPRTYNHCKHCGKRTKRTRKYCTNLCSVKAWKKANPEKRKVYKQRERLKKFGLLIEEYDVLLTEQGGGCAACGRLQEDLSRKMAVDHDHATGKVRGLLCLGCNVTLGHAGDNPLLLRALADYLERTGSR